MGIQLLTAKKVLKASDGFYADGDGLYLRVQKNGASRTWLYRYIADGKRKHFSIGSIRAVSLDRARWITGELNSAFQDGKDLRETLDALTGKNENEDRTFAALLPQALDDIANVKRWKNKESERQWRSTLTMYALPILADMDIDAITAEDIRAVVQPIWETKTETASRVLGRLSTVMDWAIAKGYRTKPNPALWRSQRFSLASPERIKKTRHFAAVPVEEMPQLCGKLWDRPNLGSLAVLFGILTASRVSEFLKARWEEFDLENRLWSMPAERRKDGQQYPHRVPLSDQALAVLAKLPRMSEYLFPGTFTATLSTTTPCNVLRRMGYTVTMHGCRSTFNDWAARSKEDYVASEKALSHAVGNKVTQAYLRTDMLDERKGIMQRWANYCLPDLK